MHLIICIICIVLCSMNGFLCMVLHVLCIVLHNSLVSVLCNVCKNPTNNARYTVSIVAKQNRKNKGKARKAMFGGNGRNLSYSLLVVSDKSALFTIFSFWPLYSVYIAWLVKQAIYSSLSANIEYCVRNCKQQFQNAIKSLIICTNFLYCCIYLKTQIP